MFAPKQPGFFFTAQVDPANTSHTSPESPESHRQKPCVQFGGTGAGKDAISTGTYTMVGFSGFIEKSHKFACPFGGLVGYVVVFGE